MSDFAEEPRKSRREDTSDAPRRRDDYDDDERRDPGDYDIRRRGGNLADRGSRFVAALIDGVLTFLCQIPGIIMVSSTISSDRMSVLGNPFAMMQVAFAGFLVMELGVLAYQGLMAYLISQSGQTLGKKAMGIRIVLYENGRLPGVVHGWVLRWLPMHVLAFVPFIGSLLTLIDVLFIFGEEKRCIHDLIAGTKVVVAEPLPGARRERDYDDDR